MKKAQYSPADKGENEDDTPREFPEIDHIGIYTLSIYFILSLPLILSAARALSYVFTTGKVNYRCLVPECENSANATFEPFWLQNAVPYTADGKPETCTRFLVQNSTDSCSTSTYINETQGCSSWVYDMTERTILNEWDITCDSNRWKLTLPGTINHLGQFAGLLISGHMSDRYGRRNLLTVGTTISSILGLIRSFSVNYEMYIAFEFLDAMAGSAIYSAVYVLGMEFVGPKNRVRVTNVAGCMYVVWAVILGLFAKWLLSWRLLLRVFYAPGLLAIFLPFLVPESVRWLQSKGRLEEAESVLRKIARRNKIEMSEKSIRMLRNWKRDDSQRATTSISSSVSPAKQIITNKRILLRLLTCAFCWVANTFVYYGLSLRSVEVPGDKYINFILVMGVEFPATIIASILAEYFGRRRTFSIAYFFSGFFCIITNYVPEGWWHLPLIVFVIGKFCISVNYNLAYIFTAELFPISLRHSIITLCSMIGRIGSMLAPQAPLLAYFMPSLPLLMFGVMAILAGLLSLTFPETLGKKLPDTVHEAENIGKVKSEEGSPAPCVH